MKTLMLGNEAVARGLYEAGCSFVSSYPGTPSTEITEAAAKYPEIYAEWAPNEKVAMEVGLRRLPGRAAQLLRHEARGPERGRRPPVHHCLYRRERRHGDRRGRRRRACTRPRTSRIPATTPKPPRCPCWSPRIPPKCLDFAKLAYELSEQFDTPVLLKMCTRVAHSQSVVEPGQRDGAAAEAL